MKQVYSLLNLLDTLILIIFGEIRNCFMYIWLGHIKSYLALLTDTSLPRYTVFTYWICTYFQFTFSRNIGALFHIWQSHLFSVWNSPKKLPWSRLPGKYSLSLLIEAIGIGIKNVFVYYVLTTEIRKTDEIVIRKSGSSSF